MSLLTVNEVAIIFQVKPHTIRNWLKRKQFPEGMTIKMGESLRFRKSELEKFLSNPES